MTITGSSGPHSYAAQSMLDVHSTLDDCQQLSLCTLEPEDLNLVLIEAHRLKERSQALFAQVANEAANQQLSRRFGEHSLSTHIAGQTHGNSKRIGAELSFARWLHRFPALHTGLAEGTVTIAHLHSLRTLENKQPKLSDHMEHAQDFFIEAAINLQFPQWVDAVGYWADSIDPDGELTDPTDPKYGVDITVLPNGDVIVKMRLDAVTGEGFLIAVEHEEHKVHDSEADLPDSQKSTIKQRTMTAVMRLIARGYQRKDGSFPEPMIQLVMSEKVAEDLLARALGCIDPDEDGPMEFDPFKLPIDYDSLDGRCETLRGTPVHPMHALIPLLIGKMRRLVITEYNQAVEEPEDVPEFRLFTKKQRQVLLALARGKCSISGCHNPYSWLQMDHINPHSHGGPTLLPNGQPLCQPHNKAKGNRRP